MQQAKIVATGPVGQNAIDILAPVGRVIVAPSTAAESITPLLEGAVALLVRGEAKVDKPMIEAGRELKVIARSGVGYNNVDIASATARKIPVVYTPGAGARAVAEAAMALMLALCKRLAYWDEQLKAGNWQSRYEAPPGDLEGSTLGIVGFGRIGQQLARLATPFDMTILAHDPFVSADQAERLGVHMVELDELLSRSDFVSIHAAATGDNRGLISRQRLKLIKPGACLMNLARGELIESLDILHEALQDGRLAAVGLDVFAPEPPDVSHPIFKMENCLTAPHCLGASRGAMERIYKSMSEDVVAFLRGQRPRHVVNPEVFE